MVGSNTARLSGTICNIGPNCRIQQFPHYHIKQQQKKKTQQLIAANETLNNGTKELISFILARDGGSAALLLLQRGVNLNINCSHLSSSFSPRCCEAGLLERRKNKAPCAAASALSNESQRCLLKIYPPPWHRLLGGLWLIQERERGAFWVRWGKRGEKQRKEDPSFGGLCCLSAHVLHFKLEQGGSL